MWTLPNAQACEALLEALLEEALSGLTVAAEPVRGSDELFSFRREECGEDLGMDSVKRTAEPNVEEVGQVRIANVVVVRRVRADLTAPAKLGPRRVRLAHLRIGRCGDASKR